MQAGDGLGVGVERLEAAVHAQARHDLADLAGAGDAVERRLGHVRQPIREVLRGEVGVVAGGHALVPGVHGGHELLGVQARELGQPLQGVGPEHGAALHGLLELAGPVGGDAGGLGRAVALAHGDAGAVVACVGALEVPDAHAEVVVEDAVAAVADRRHPGRVVGQVAHGPGHHVEAGLELLAGLEVHAAAAVVGQAPAGLVEQKPRALGHLALAAPEVVPVVAVARAPELVGRAVPAAPGVEAAHAGAHPQAHAEALARGPGHGAALGGLHVGRGAVLLERVEVHAEAPGREDGAVVGLVVGVGLLGGGHLDARHAAVLDDERRAPGVHEHLAAGLLGAPGQQLQRGLVAQQRAHGAVLDLRVGEARGHVGPARLPRVLHPVEPHGAADDAGAQQVEVDGLLAHVVELVHDLVDAAGLARPGVAVEHLLAAAADEGRVDGRVGAGAADEGVLLDDDGLEAGLRGHGRGGGAAHARAHDHDVGLDVPGLGRADRGDGHGVGAHVPGGHRRGVAGVGLGAAATTGKRGGCGGRGGRCGLVGAGGRGTHGSGGHTGDGGPLNERTARDVLHGAMLLCGLQWPRRLLHRRPGSVVEQRPQRRTPGGCKAFLFGYLPGVLFFRAAVPPCSYQDTRPAAGNQFATKGPLCPRPCRKARTVPEV